jgi:hypothetical protein
MNVINEKVAHLCWSKRPELIIAPVSCALLFDSSAEHCRGSQRYLA